VPDRFPPGVEVQVLIVQYESDPLVVVAPNQPGSTGLAPVVACGDARMPF